MKIQFLLPVAFLLVCSAVPATADLQLQPNDRVAFCGDEGSSIFIEDYLLMSQPTAGLDFARFGWIAGEPVGFLARMDKCLLPYKPTVVLTNYGGSNADISAYGKAQTDLIEALKKAGVRTIVIGSPACVDSVDYQHDPAKAAAQNKLLGAFADMAKQVAEKESVRYADVYGATMATMIEAKGIKGHGYVTDGEITSLTVASAFLKALGCAGDIGTITVDYGASTAEGTPGQKILSFKDNTLNIESTHIPFWFPGHGVGAEDPVLPWPSLKFIPFGKELNRYTLVVKNLPGAHTKVYWGDANQDFSSEELANGVNLADVIPGWGNPFGGTFSNVDNGVRMQSGTEYTSSAAIIQGKPEPDSDAKRTAALQLAVSRFAPVKTTIKLQPLAEVEKQPPGSIPVIVDTDLDGDVDDVGAVALLNDFMDQGEAKLLACVHNTINAQQSSCAAIHAINTYYGHGSTPIGQSGNRPTTSVLLAAPPDGYQQAPGPFGSSYTLQLHQRFDPDFPNDDKVPAGVDVYRKTLASAADGTVVICSVGTMENIQNLLLSQPDSVSDLNGLDLVRRKVRQLVIMANTVPQDHYLLSKWPTRIVWTTYVGSGIGTGPSLINTPENNPVRMAYDLFGVLHTGRQSWDLTAAWLAVRGPGEVWDVVAGRPQYINDITHTPTVPHPNECEVSVKMSYPDAAKVIGDELARPPRY